MNELEKMFPSLTLFSDLNWDQVTAEYQENYIDISFPEYLQQKALDGDCPIYLFELAFYELAVFDAKTSMDPFPHLPGVHLNPTSLFLSLEFDVKKMLDDSKSGKIDVIERAHVLCIFRDTHDELHMMDVSEDELELLQHLELGPQENKKFVETKNQTSFEKFVKNGLILDLL